MKDQPTIQEILTPSEVAVGIGNNRQQVGGTVYQFSASHSNWNELHNCAMDYENCPAVAGSTGAVCNAFITIQGRSILDTLGAVYCGKRPQAVDVDSLKKPIDEK